MYDLAMGKSRMLATLARDRHHRFIRNTIDEMEWWYCFRNGRDDDTALPREAVVAPSGKPASTMVSNRSTVPKIGRNDACPCGSGKKYKKCCLGRYERRIDCVPGWLHSWSRVFDP
ncbi:MAG: DUF1186 domain-containing protein [Acidobacteria bacterium]|nr:DUF1186 domain-containing protein [Acidobacteriota bacterium]